MIIRVVAVRPIPLPCRHTRDDLYPPVPLKPPKPTPAAGATTGETARTAGALDDNNAIQ